MSTTAFTLPRPEGLGTLTDPELCIDGKPVTIGTDINHLGISREKNAIGHLDITQLIEDRLSLMCQQDCLRPDGEPAFMAPMGSPLP